MPNPQLELPTEAIEDALIQCAIPGFYGELCVEIKILPTAALEVSFQSTRKQTTQTEVVKQTHPIVTSNERVSKVRQKISEVKQRLRLQCPVSCLRALFRDGNLVHFEVTEVGELATAKLPPAIPPARAG